MNIISSYVMLHVIHDHLVSDNQFGELFSGEEYSLHLSAFLVVCSSLSRTEVSWNFPL